MSPGPFLLRNYATFTGPLQFDELAYSYEIAEKEGIWPFDVPINTGFPNFDVGVLFFRDPTDFTHFHLYGPIPQILVLEKGAYQPLPSLFLEVLNTIVNGNIIVNGSVVCNGPVITNAAVIANGIVICNNLVNCKNIVLLAGIGNVATYMLKTRAIAVSKKSFDIPHPTKKDHRLRYVCPEGPKADVYVRGRIKDDNTIYLPAYWKDLVDPDTIDVLLTPIGSSQELFVESIQWGTKVIIKNNSSGPINCSYVVYGERKDVSPNIPEYQGLTQDDYPGDNSEYIINGD